MSQPEELDNLENKDGTGQGSDLYTASDTIRDADHGGSMKPEHLKEQSFEQDQYASSSSLEQQSSNNETSGSVLNDDVCYNNEAHLNEGYHNNCNNNDVYNNDYYNNTGYGNWQTQGSNPYQNSSYGNQQTQQGDPYQNNPYGNQQTQQGNPYQNNPYGNQQTQQGNPYQNNPYGNQQTQQGNPYQNNPYGNQQTQGGGPHSNNPYSPYAVPAKKNNVPVIIGIVAGIIILFLIAVGTLTYRVVSLYSEGRAKIRRNYDGTSEPDTDVYDQNEYGYEDYFDDYDNDYFYDYGDEYSDGFDFDYNYDSDQYYTLHDDIKYDLSYSVDFDEHEYTDDEKVVIRVSYPVIKGKDVPNLEHLNDVIQEEIALFEDYLEEYEGYLDNEDSYFSAVSMGYVTYMDEEKLSIVFSENIYTDLYSDAYLYSINIDMENGVILENENMLSIDDNFSVEFRTKSDIQNGEIAYLTGMTDQEITSYFNSSNVIVFYTPKGMEIGFNYEEGWVTVTYEEYEEYLKVF